MKTGELAQRGVEKGIRFLNDYIGQFDEMLPKGYRLERMRDKAKRSMNPLVSTFAEKQEVK